MANQYIGCILGRCCNRIKDGLFTLKGKEYQLSKNEDNNHLHGGVMQLTKFFKKFFSFIFLNLIQIILVV